MKKHVGKAPEEVFTPRAHTVNENMYVSRQALEEAFKKGLRSGLHLLMHGQSGSGKTWLYKQVLRELNVSFVTANLANASRLGGLAAEFKNIIERQKNARQTGYTEKKKAGFAGSGLEHQKEFEFGQSEPFEACLGFIRKSAGDRKALLVLDNLEAIRSEEKILKELADIITLLDDDRYAPYRVQLLIVGVPGDLREYYQNTPNLATVTNRLKELSEVRRLAQDECKTLVETGFLVELGYTVDPDLMVDIVNHVNWITDRLPQRVHEYCLELAYISEKTKLVTRAMLEEADRSWLGQSLHSSYTVVEAVMNDRETRIGRRNQVLFALGVVDTDEFRSSQVEELVRTEFPTSTHGKALNTPQILAGLAKRDIAIIKRSPKGDAFCFSDPKYRMCLRAMLRKLDDERIDKVPASQAGLA